MSSWPPALGPAFVRWFPVVAATAILACLSVGEVYRFLLGLLALAGLVGMIQARHRPWNPWLRWYLALFLCLWLPILISAVDSEHASASLSVAARYLIYLLVGWLLITRIEKTGDPRSLLIGAFAVLLLWTADGFTQHLSGFNLLGRASQDDGRLTGMFRGVKLGFVLAIFSPLFFHAVYTFGRRIPFLWLALVPYLVVILYGGSRVSWMLTLAALVLYGALLLAMAGRIDWRRMGPRVLLVIAVCAIALSQSQWLTQRFSQVAGIASNDYAARNLAVSDRLPHWQGAWQMFVENPVNGVGAKAYKRAYPKYSGGDTIPRGQPHLFVLEVAAETGALGLIGYAGFFVIVLALLWRLARRRCWQPIPWGLTLLLAAFPLSATLSFYAHFMSAMIWYLAMVFVGLAAYEEARAAE